MLAGILLNILGVIIFLFLFWRRLKEDYTQSAIFTTSAYMLLGIAAASFLTKRFFPSAWFWASFLAIVLGLSGGLLRYRMRVFETIDAAAVSLMSWLALIFLLDSINNSSLASLIGSLVILVLIILFFVFDRHYKRFSWYKSGRIGFSGLTVLGLFFLARAAIAVSLQDMLSFSGKYEVFLSAILAFVSFLLVFNLARQKT
jgi:hypothetical protein